MREVSVGTNHSAGVKQTVFTVPPKHYAKCTLVYLINNGASSKTASVWWYDSSEGVEIQIVNALSIASKVYVKLLEDTYFVLEEGDELRIQSEAASTISSMNTFELTTSRNSAIT